MKVSELVGAATTRSETTDNSTTSGFEMPTYAAGEILAPLRSQSYGAILQVVASTAHARDVGLCSQDAW